MVTIGGTVIEVYIVYQVAHSKERGAKDPGRFKYASHESTHCPYSTYSTFQYAASTCSRARLLLSVERLWSSALHLVIL